MAIVYHIEHLTKVYRGSAKKANNRLTLSIQEGEIFGLLGPNGAGKSTLVNQIAGITRPTTGSIELFGIDVVKHPEAIPEYVALQPQHVVTSPKLYPRLEAKFIRSYCEFNPSLALPRFWCCSLASRCIKNRKIVYFPS